MTLQEFRAIKTHTASHGAKQEGVSEAADAFKNNLDVNPELDAKREREKYERLRKESHIDYRKDAIYYGNRGENTELNELFSELKKPHDENELARMKDQEVMKKREEEKPGSLVAVLFERNCFWGLSDNYCH